VSDLKVEIEREAHGVGMWVNFPTAYFIAHCCLVVDIAYAVAWLFRWRMRSSSVVVAVLVLSLLNYGFLKWNVFFWHSPEGHAAKVIWSVPVGIIFGVVEAYLWNYPRFALVFGLLFAWHVAPGYLAWTVVRMHGQKQDRQTVVRACIALAGVLFCAYYLARLIRPSML
jgi:hypothetical protein